MIKLNALFVGKTSLGYEHGKRYDIVLADTKSMSIRRADRTGLCTYSSLSSFLKNWDDIKKK